MSWLYNVFKGQAYPDDEEPTIIIDNNDKVTEHVERFQEELIKRRELRYQKKVEDFLNALEYDEEGKPLFEMDEEGYAIVPMDDDGHPLITVDEEGNIITDMNDSDSEPEFSELSFDETMSDESMDIGESAEQIIDDARMQAQMIIDDANSQAQAIMSDASEQGRMEGYQAGIEQGQQEYRQKEEELELLKSSLESEYSQKLLSMEKDLVDTICDVVGRVFRVQFEDDREIIYHICENAIMNIDSSNVFIIKVNEKNSALLKAKKDSLLERVGQDTQLDIVLDPLMSDDQCIIETDGGIFDCGMDVQMTNLIKAIKSLSAGR